jgi:penicillin-binding protein 2
MAGYESDGTRYSRRMLMLGVAQGAFYTVLVGRLQYLQIARADDYATMAEANRVNVLELSSPRGRITDRKGRLLAGNDRNLTVELVPEQAADLSQTLNDLQALLDLSAARMREIRRKIKRNPSFSAVTVAENLSWEQFSALNLNLPFLPGVTPKVGEKRVYPENEAAAHVVGYVGSKTRADVQRIGKIADKMVGRSGLERQYEDDLRGRPGVRHVEVNANGRTVRELQTRPGEAGSDLALSVDLDLQNFTAQRMRSHSGSTVVMDVTTGEVLTMVSTPSYDPNEFADGISVKRWEQLLEHERKPLMNKAIRGLYAPGSTFKMLVALAALQDGLIDPSEEVTCSGVFSFANESFHCWEQKGHGPTNMIQALEKSCDVYFYDLALRVGIDRIEAVAKKFGFGLASGVDLLGEKSGTVPGRDWKRANYDAGWRSGETVITAIGQGYLLATPLQLAIMTAALANGGQLVTPRMTRPDGALPPKPSLNIDPTHLKIIRTGLYRAVNKPDGTGYGSSLLINGRRMSGKTGTVQVRRISKDERETGVIPNSKLDWHLRDHSLFVGYVPHDTPRYAISVVIEHGGGGAQVAAPIARDVMVRLLRSTVQHVPAAPASGKSKKPQKRADIRGAL